MKRIDLMVDIETLGKDVMSPIIQLAAVAFDLTTGKTLDGMVAYPRLKSKEIIDGDTLTWWLNTNKELLTKILNTNMGNGIGHEDERDVIYRWIKFIRDLKNEYKLNDEDVYLWGNGILFDNRILKGKCEQYGAPYPIYYRNDRDVRTILELYQIAHPHWFEKSKQEAREGLIEHNATDDCFAQIKMVRDAYHYLIWGDGF